MTKIKMLNDRIIFDGHADSRQECETITLMCDNLAQSKDFKTIRYESGYAEFEKVGKTEELKFVSSYKVRINFDSHITKVSVPLSSGGSEKEVTEWTTSGAMQTLNGGQGQGGPFTVTLANGYVIDTITGVGQRWGEAPFAVNFNIENNTFTFDLVDSTTYDISITSKLPNGKQKINISTLLGWANLSAGNHQITVKTTSNGTQSESSNAVTVKKAEAGHNVKIMNGADESINTISLHYTLTTTDGKILNGILTNTGTGEDFDYANVKNFSFTVDCSNEDNPWHVVIAELGIDVSDTVSYTSETYTLTNDITVDFSTGSYAV